MTLVFINYSRNSSIRISKETSALTFLRCYEKSAPTKCSSFLLHFLYYFLHIFSRRCAYRPCSTTFLCKFLYAYKTRTFIFLTKNHYLLKILTVIDFDMAVCTYRDCFPAAC